MKAFLKGFFIAGLVLIALSWCVTTFGQEQRRKAAFGVGLSGLDKSSLGAQEIIQKGLEEHSKLPALTVVDVLPNSTAEALGIKKGDILISINGVQFPTVQDFGEFLDTKFEGDPIEAVLISNGEKVVKKGVFKGKRGTAPANTTATKTASGQLQRRAAIGLGVKPLDEPTATANKIPMGTGLIVTMVAPKSTAEEAGLKVGDVVLSINGQPMNTPQAFVAFVGTKYEGDALEAEVVSGGVKSFKKGIFKAKPKENSDSAEVIYDATEMRLGTLRTITYKPKNATGKMPAVFYIQGLPCQTHELGPDSKDPRKMAFEDWVKAGFVVFRVERPGIGDSKTTKECRDINFDEEIETNNAGYKKLLSYDFVDTDNIFFFGHSMGGWTAPFIAQTKQPKGIIVYGTGIRSWFEYFIDLYRIQSTYGGDSHVAAEKESREMIPMLYEWLENGKTAEEMRKDPKLKPIVDKPGMFEGEYFQGRAFGRSAHFFHTMSKQNLAEAWSKVEGKVLAVYGEFDVQALNARDAVIIAETVNQARPGNGEFLLIPKIEHIFAKATSYKQVSDLYGSGQFFKYASENYNPEFGRLTNEWIKKVMGK